MKPDRVASAEGRIEKTILARVAPGEDIFAAIREICRRHEIRSGYIATLIGSLISADVVCVTEDPDDPTRSVYPEPLRMEGRLELVTGSGIIGTDDRGRLSIHIHGLLSDEYMDPVAGHLVDSGANIVLATAELVINSFFGAEFSRSFDEETGFVLFKVRSSKS